MTPGSMPIEATEWRLADHAGPDGALVAVPPDILATAVFTDGVVSGSTGCNRYHAAYALDDASLEIGPAAMTMMACDPDRTAVEQAFTLALAATAAWVIDDDALELLDAGRRVRLRFRATTGPALVDTEWVASGINNGRGGVVSVLAGVEVTARLGADSRVAGSGGCNRFFGPYAVDGDAISIGPLATTRMACIEPEGVGEQETAFLAALGRVATWSIREGRLQLRAADGALQAEFRAATE
jgi:heat shock protein HslJ